MSWFTNIFKEKQPEPKNILMWEGSIILDGKQHRLVTILNKNAVDDDGKEFESQASFMKAVDGSWEPVNNITNKGNSVDIGRGKLFYDIKKSFMKEGSLIYDPNSPNMYKTHRQVLQIDAPHFFQGGAARTQIQKQTQKHKVKVLGRERVVYKQGRSNMICYKGKMIPLKDARALEKKLKKQKKASS
jgi:hypothetical protein